MSVNTDSMHFYHYLCHKIGSEKEVKARRLTFMATDTSNGVQVSSGSKSEGLNLKGSDIDLMFIDPGYKVYESETDIFQSQETVLLMDTADTPPCFTRLRLYTNYNWLYNDVKEVLVQHGMECFMSNDLFKQKYLKLTSPCITFMNKIHGPCLSAGDDRYDNAYCLKMDKWISQAVPWINRPRSSWLSPEIISKITVNGVLFVPIGFKNSIHEDLEWRISFSVAEKFLIFSFNHTQLLCYALLKIVLKEIIEKNENLKGLLCSYYLKTLMFWISDDTNPTDWRPDNIIPCFMSCLKRLLYCIEYSTLLHYFITDFNFFCLRLNTEVEKKKSLSNLLRNLYQQGIQCFSASETLHGYARLSTTTTSQFNITSKLIHDVLEICNDCPASFDETSISICLNRLLHYCKTDLSKVFLYYLSKAHQHKPQIQHTHNSQSNKQQYSRYKYDLSHLLVGVHSDAVAGWLMLASFFYVHDKYLTSLCIINYALLQITDEKCENRFKTMVETMPRIIFTPEQESAIDMIKNEKLITTLKSLTISKLRFECMSQIIPKELQHDVMTYLVDFHPSSFAHFLRFLCLFHLHEHIACEDALQQLLHANNNILCDKERPNFLFLHSNIFVGIAGQMIGKTFLAETYFTFAAKFDKFNRTTAGKRFRELLT
ncbi:cyclic GMP-AMP synthase-like receptor 2 [Mytilus edulis]|uniref:cyclic GMP-AMP synthase-like receptor 2 n=1 Tax=Mytilus edulis TaxID=6550 RepID=UPI0039EFA06B